VRRAINSFFAFRCRGLHCEIRPKVDSGRQAKFRPFLISMSPSTAHVRRRSRLELAGGVLLLRKDKAKVVASLFETLGEGMLVDLSQCQDY
jgi:hypothetical protein